MPDRRHVPGTHPQASFCGPLWLLLAPPSAAWLWGLSRISPEPGSLGSVQERAACLGVASPGCCNPLPLPSGSLVDKRGNILIPGINEAVAAVTEEEHKLYDDIDFDIEEFAKDVGAQILLHNNKVLIQASTLPPAWATL